MSDEADASIVVRGQVNGAAASLRFELGALHFRAPHGMVGVTERTFTSNDVAELDRVRHQLSEMQRFSIVAGAAAMGLFTKSVVVGVAMLGFGVISEVARRLFRGRRLRLRATNGLELDFRIAGESRARVDALLDAVGRRRLPPAAVAKSSRLGSGDPEPQ